MADPVFLVGPVSLGAARVLALGVAAYAVATAGHTRRAYRKRLEDRGSSLLATFVMAGLAWLLWKEGASILPAPYSLVVLVLSMTGVVVTLGYTLSDAEKRLERLREHTRIALEEWADKLLPPERKEQWLEARIAELGEEERRKTPHLLMGLFIAGYLFLGGIILRGALRLVRDPNALSPEILHNLRVPLDAGLLAAGHIVSLTLLLGLLFLLLPVEMVRLRFPQLGYPFKGTITSLMREREQGLFGAHYYIAATLPLSVMLLTRDPAGWETSLYAVVAVLVVSIFGDSASAIFGRRYGRRKWPHNRNKSFVGTAAGTLVSVVLALPFVGVVGAIACGVVFLLVDVLAPVPFSASDNILNPLALAAALLAIQDHLDPWLPYY